MSDGGGDAWFFAWTPDDYPARVISVPDGWDEIRERYSPRRKNAPLERLIEIATEHEVESVLIGEDADSPCRCRTSGTQRMRSAEASCPTPRQQPLLNLSGSFPQLIVDAQVH